MKTPLTASLLSLLFPLLVWADSDPVAQRIPDHPYQTISAKDTHANIILLTIDGVRWQEVFHGIDPKLSNGEVNDRPVMNNLMKRLYESGMLLGDHKNGSDATVSNSVNISLPAYQSMMTGITQNCLTNICVRPSTETIQERLLDTYKLNRYQVASLASWETISKAVESKKGRTVVNTGRDRLDDPLADSELDAIHKSQSADSPSWNEARFDKYTTQLALWYLKRHKPRFLYISLNDSDEWAHRNKYSNYIEAIRKQDDFIETLLNTLDQMGEYGKSTTVLVTTDHGRGDGRQWSDHGLATPEAKYIWFAALGPTLKTKVTLPRSTRFQHNDLLPTILSIMGIKTQTCSQCGKPINELVSAVKR